MLQDTQNILSDTMSVVLGELFFHVDLEQGFTVILLLLEDHHQGMQFGNII